MYPIMWKYVNSWMRPSGGSFKAVIDGQQRETAILLVIEIIKIFPARASHQRETNVHQNYNPPPQSPPPTHQPSA